MVSIAFVGLVLISVYSFFKNKRFITNHRESASRTSSSGSTRSTKHFEYHLLLPILLFIATVISLFYSANINQGLKVLGSQFKFLAIPFIFLVHQQGIKGRICQYLQLFLTATSIAAFLTFLFFLMPSEWVQRITETIPLLKDYIVQDKALAFGVYSPFTERLQFSYLIGVAIFFQFWLLFNRAQNSSLLKPLVRIGILMITLLILGARGAQISFLIASIVWIIGGYFYFIHPKLIQKFSSFLSYSILGLSLVFFLIITPLIAYKEVPAVKVRYDQMQWEIGTFRDGTYPNYDYTHFTSIRRLLSWKNSWSIIQDNPIIGVGIGDYQAEMKKAYAKDQLGFPVNTQSQFLYYWAASGILGLLGLLFLLGYAGINVMRQKVPALRFLGLSFIIFYSLLFLFDAPLNFQVGSMTFLTFYSLLAILNSKNKVA